MIGTIAGLTLMAVGGGLMAGGICQVGMLPIWIWEEEDQAKEDKIEEAYKNGYERGHDDGVADAELEDFKKQLKEV